MNFFRHRDKSEQNPRKNPNEVVQQAIFRDIKVLTAPGRRDIKSSGHEKARTYLLERMKNAGLQPYSPPDYNLPYTVNGIHFANLAGLIPGRGKIKSLPPLLIGAHYDTCGAQPGADDNAASVAILLALAGEISKIPLDRDLVIVFFDAEEPPYFKTSSMGSVVFRKHQEILAPACAVILDMVAHNVPFTGIEDILFMTGVESHATLGEIIKHIDIPKSIKIIPVLNRYPGDMSDHYAFRTGGTPYLFMSSGRWPHYHQPTDIPERLNMDKAMGVFELLLSIVKKIDSSCFGTSMKTHDTLELEIGFMKSILGEFLESSGLTVPESRAEMDRIVSLLMNRFGL